MEYMKNCPFCNGEPTLFSTRGKYGYFVFIKCDLCGAQGKTFKMGETREENWQDSVEAQNAIKMWNMRAGTGNG